MEPKQAADFIHRYGNVAKESGDLLREKPTESQLKSAEDKCLFVVQSAFAAIRQHHGMVVEVK